MFLTDDQIRQLQDLCEDVASRRTRSGQISIVIRNNMPREFQVEIPVFDNDHVMIGKTTRIIRCQLPEEEIAKGRQKNRLPGKR